MSDISANNKRIAKNTLVLYVRMLFSMIVSLYTSRVILQTLGVEDYGIYNVVGGVVGMFSILSGSLSAAISRFITFELGTGDSDKLKRVFSSSVTIQLCLAIIVVLLAETIGLWFLNNKMIIHSERMVAANWIFQFSLVTFVVNLISIPYNAAIIAHEKMTAFAYIGILEVLAKLGIVFLLLVSPIDRLIFYGLLLMVWSFIVRIIYGVYCKRKFEECNYNFELDRSLLKAMFGFAGWNFIGASSAILRDQGGNIIINLFCGTTVNAARSVAMQVNNVVSGFVSNFMVAVNPQITKSYASGEQLYMMNLIYRSAKFSFYLLLMLSLPIIVNADYILDLWLDVVPEHTSTFLQLALLFTLSETLANPLVTVMLATGHIRNYQIVVGGMQMMNLPLSYVFLRLGYPPETVFVVAIIVSVCCELSRVYMLRRMINLSVRSFMKDVYAKVIVVLVVSATLPFVLKWNVTENFINFILCSIVSLASTIFTVYYIGCNGDERTFLRTKIKRLINKIIK